MRCDPYLSGSALTALTTLYWTSAPFQNGAPLWLTSSIDLLLEKGLAERADTDIYNITNKGKAFVEAIHAIPEPQQKWVIE